MKVSLGRIAVTMNHYRFNRRRTIPVLFLTLFLGLRLAAQSDLQPILDLSTVLEMRAAIRRGTAFLIANQAGDGSWSDSPAITARCLTAMTCVGGEETDGYQQAVSNSHEYLARVLQAQLPVHIPTACRLSDIAAIARLVIPLGVLDNPIDRPLIERTRQFITFAFLQVWNADEPAVGQARPLLDIDLFELHQIVELLSLAMPEVSPIEYTSGAITGARPVFWVTLSEYIVACQSFVTESKPSPWDGAFFGFPETTARTVPGQPISTCDRLTPALYTMSGIIMLLRADATGNVAPMDRGLRWLDQQPMANALESYHCSGMYTWLYMTAKMRHRREVAAGAGRMDGRWRAQVAASLLERQLGGGQWQGVRGAWGEQDATLCTAYAILAMALCAR